MVGTKTMHTCGKCGKTKPVGDFPFKGRYRNGDQRYGYCKPCHGEYQRQNRLARVFNITIAEYDALAAAQDNRCAICGRAPKNNRLSVDHDHISGQIRGLICMRCNRGLGFWNDDAGRIEAALEYIRTPPAVAVIGERFGRKGRVTNRAPKKRKAPP